MKNVVPSYHVEKLSNHFPLLKNKVNGQELIYFDNAATTQKPQAVIDAISNFYRQSNANVHRASHAISAIATQQYEEARDLVRNFIGAKNTQEIIWTKGTTEAINLVAHSWGRAHLAQGDEIVLSQSEHHANIVPWQLIAQQTGAVIKVVSIASDGRIDLDDFARLVSDKTKIVCVAHISNVVGKINPVKEIIKQAKSVGALTLIDGAQAVGHIAVDMVDLDCDFYAFSAHKMYGPTGVGVLYGREALLNTMPPWQSGGEMIKSVSFQKTEFNSLPFKFEPGTPNISGVIGFAEAIKFLSYVDKKAMQTHEKMQIQAMYTALKEIPEVNCLFDGQPDIPLFSFTLKNFHSHDLASALDAQGIAVRSGHHCAMPLIESLKIQGCVRVSLASYNTSREISIFIEKLKKIIKQEQRGNLNEASESGLTSLGLLTKSMRDIPDASEDMIQKFSKVKGWDSRHREIMLLSKQLDRLDEHLCDESNEVKGCESKAWLSLNKTDLGEFYFKANSNAKVIRGLLVIVLAAYNNKSKSQILAFDIDAYFASLGLMQHLSPSRGNGVLAIVDRIKTIVANT